MPLVVTSHPRHSTRGVLCRSTRIRHPTENAQGWAQALAAFSTSFATRAGILSTTTPIADVCPPSSPHPPFMDTDILVGAMLPETGNNHLLTLQAILGGGIF